MSGEARMVRGVLRAGACAIPVSIGIAFAIRGGRGAVAAAVAMGLVIANAAVAGAVLAYAARRQPVFFPMVAMPSYALRMAGILFAMAALRNAGSVDGSTFVVVFGVGVVGALAIEWRIWSRTPWAALTFERPKETT